MIDRLENFDSDELAKYVNPPKIKIFGVGGAGNNIMERLYIGNITGVETIALDTDATKLNSIKASKRIVLGAETCKGRGAGGDPHIGRRSVKEAETALKECIKDSDMVYIIAGMGGGTGTGAAPAIAKMATDMDTELVIGISILPFEVEGKVKRKISNEGIEEFRRNCTTIIQLDNETLNEYEECKSYGMERMFGVMSDFITNIVKEKVEIITKVSTINVDYADIKKVLTMGGQAKIMYGHSNTSDPESVLNNLLGNPLIGSDYHGSKAIVIHIQAGKEFTLRSCEEIIGALRVNLDEDVNMIWGYRTDPDMGNAVKVVMIASAVPDDDDVVGSAFGDKSGPGPDNYGNKSGLGPDNYGNALGIPMVN